MVPIDLASIDEYLQARIEEHHIPALSVAIVRDGETLVARAHGVANLEWDAAATPDTSFQLASVTKLLTATLLMALVEDGAVRLDASVLEYLPDAPESWAAITLRHLASHTSGIPDNVGTVASVAEAVEAAAQLPVLHMSGEKVRYGLLDFTVLTQVLETVTGKDFQSLLRDRLLTPLQLTSTRFDNTTELSDQPVRVSDVVPHRASIYEWEGQAQRAYSFLFPAWTYSAGGLLSSAADLARWAAALDGGDFLRPDSLEQMWTPQRLTDGTNGPFGVGWIVDEHRGDKVTGHSGGPALADIVRFPDKKLTIIVLTNQQNLRPYLAMGVADVLSSNA